MKKFFIKKPIVAVLATVIVFCATAVPVLAASFGGGNSYSTGLFFIQHINKLI